MLYSRALVCALLFSLPAAAQVAAPPLAPSTAGRTFAVGGAIVRLPADGGAAPAAVSRDGGRTFQALPPTDDRLYLRYGTFDPLRDPPATPGALAAPAGGTLFVVQSRTPILPEYRQALLASGLEVVAYFPMNGYVVRGDREVALALAARPWVRWVGEVAVGYKLEEQLVERVLGGPTAAAQPADYDVVLVRKSDRARLMAQIAELGGKVGNPNDGSVYLVASLTPQQLAMVAALDTVMWIDASTPISTDMNNARIQGGANYVEAAGGFTGTGVRAEISEGLDQTHPDWTHPILIRYDTTDSHGHCTASIVGLNGSGNALARGMMPNCQIIETSFGGWGGTSRYAIIQGSVNPLLPWHAMQQTASWGNTTTTAYTSVSQEMDNALFDFDLACTQSQSNTGTQLSRPQAWAKNIISVGGVVHHDTATPLDDNWSGASIGPATDGRIKPDVCAYYDLVLTGDLVGAAGYSATNYFSGFNGTSAATPIVNGHVGLIQEMFTDGLFGNPLPLPATPANRFQNKPHMSTAKALLCNTAASYPFSGATANLTRTHQGWGFPDLARLYDNREKIVVVDEYQTLSQGQAATYLVWIRPGTADFRATMVYADPEAVANAAITRINSVDLELSQVGGSSFWWGNNGLLLGNVSSPGGAPNDRDTIENVWLQAPAPGIYAVTVSAPTIVQDGHVETPQLDVDYALVVHPVGGGYHDRAGMTLDLISTAPGDVRVQVNNVPAAGWIDGFTFFSFDTFGPAGFGKFFGLQDDFLTVGIFGLPATPGDVFHFTNAGAGSYPFVTFTIDPAIALALSGLNVDAMVTLFDGSGQIVEQSNVDRVTIQ